MADLYPLVAGVIEAALPPFDGHGLSASEIHQIVNLGSVQTTRAVLTGLVREERAVAVESKVRHGGTARLFRRAEPVTDLFTLLNGESK